jgi:hypothetical protein
LVRAREMWMTAKENKEFRVPYGSYPRCLVLKKKGDNNCPKGVLVQRIQSRT